MRLAWLTVVPAPRASRTLLARIRMNPARAAASCYAKTDPRERSSSSAGANVPF